MALYLLSIFCHQDIVQSADIFLYEDNRGAYMMILDDQSTTRTCYTDIQYFSFLDWVEVNLINIQSIPTLLNNVNMLTKSMLRMIFHYQVNILLGK